MDGSQLVEPIPVADIFCSGVGAIEAVGRECLRVYLYVLQPLLLGGPQEKVVVAKIVVPRDAVPAEVVAALRRAGVSMPHDSEAGGVARH